MYKTFPFYFRKLYKIYGKYGKIVTEANFFTLLQLQIVVVLKNKYKSEV